MGKLIIETNHPGIVWDGWEHDTSYDAADLQEATAALRRDLDRSASEAFTEGTMARWNVAAGEPVEVDNGNGELIRFRFDPTA